MDDTDLEALGRPASGHSNSLLDVTTEGPLQIINPSNPTFFWIPSLHEIHGT